jgi:hypothetical protein
MIRKIVKRLFPEFNLISKIPEIERSLQIMTATHLRERYYELLKQVPEINKHEFRLYSQNARMGFSCIFFQKYH